MQIVRQDEQLLAAAYGGKLTEFQRLVEQEEVGVNSKNEFGVSALHMAVMSGSLHVAAYMLSRSANVNAQGCDSWHRAPSLTTNNVCQMMRVRLPCTKLALMEIPMPLGCLLHTKLTLVQGLG